MSKERTGPAGLWFRVQGLGQSSQEKAELLFVASGLLMIEGLSNWNRNLGVYQLFSPKKKGTPRNGGANYSCVKPPPWFQSAEFSARAPARPSNPSSEQIRWMVHCTGGRSRANGGL